MPRQWTMTWLHCCPANANSRKRISIIPRPRWCPAPKVESSPKAKKPPARTRRCRTATRRAVPPACSASSSGCCGRIRFGSCPGYSAPARCICCRERRKGTSSFVAPASPKRWPYRCVSRWTPARTSSTT
uniref:(northern house mosquito) hypothetical protein n=1 Tax=Culex pipiens TaxID=7175 RepID=A0A8D8GAB8_CULPI